MLTTAKSLCNQLSYRTSSWYRRKLFGVGQIAQTSGVKSNISEQRRNTGVIFFLTQMDSKQDTF